MENSVKQTFSFQLDWRWIVAGYCYLVIFHLLPSVMIGGYATPVRPIDPAPTFRMADIASLWLFVGLAVVAFVIGYRSRGFTILEPAISGVLYAFTTAAGFQRLFESNVRERETLALVFWVLIVIILTVVSAWIGEIVQRRTERVKSET